MPWIAVRERFSRLIADLQVTPGQYDDALTKFANVGDALQREYYAEPPEGGSRLLVGSWGKATQVRPSHDLDMFFVLPAGEKARFDGRAGNIQSQLLQEVKEVLAATYGQTDIRGDGQVVVVAFNTITVEVVPAFWSGSSFIIPDTNQGGRWKRAHPFEEMANLNNADRAYGGNARALSQMMKTWKRENTVALPSFALEIIVCDFLNRVEYGGGQTPFWFDWYVRDFLRHLCQMANGAVILPGTGEHFPLGDAWLPKAEAAQKYAVEACRWEQSDYDVTAGQTWQKIFGTRIPINV